MLIWGTGGLSIELSQIKSQDTEAIAQSGSTVQSLLKGLSRRRESCRPGIVFRGAAGKQGPRNSGVDRCAAPAFHLKIRSRLPQPRRQVTLRSWRAAPSSRRDECKFQLAFSSREFPTVSSFTIIKQSTNLDPASFNHFLHVTHIHATLCTTPVCYRHYPSKDP